MRTGAHAAFQHITFVVVWRQARLAKRLTIQLLDDVHRRCYAVFVEQTVLVHVVRKSQAVTCLLIPFAVFFSNDSNKIEYSFGLKPTNSMIGFPAVSSLNFPKTFFFAVE